MAAVNPVPHTETHRQIADTFLWAIARAMPSDLKQRIARILPTELTSRMDLYSDLGETKVA